MLSKIILFIAADKTTYGRWRLGKRVSYEILSNDKSGHDQLGKYLTQHPRTPIDLIVDTVEDNFRLESFPHTYGGTRKEMIERKLGQIYRNSNYRIGQFVGREVDKRRDDQFLFMGLLNPALITPWINLIMHLQAPLAGIYLQPSVSQLLLSKLNVKSPHLLMMTKQSTGFRQTYFFNQQLRISRLTPFAGMDSKLIENGYVSETENIRQYLISLQMISIEDPVHVLLVTTGELINEEMIKPLQASPNLSCRVISGSQLARLVGLDSKLLQQIPDLLHMHLLARYHCPGNLISAQQTEHYRVHNLRSLINLTSIATIIAVMTISVFNFIETADLDQQRQNLLDQTQKLEKSYEQSLLDFPKTNRSGSELKVISNLAKKINDLKRTPQQMMQLLGSALDKHNDIQLNLLHWRLVEKQVQTIDAVENNSESNIKSPPLSLTDIYEMGFIDGVVNHSNGDLIAAMNSIDRLINLLKENPAVEQVSILKKSEKPSTQNHLLGNTLDQQLSPNSTVKFKLKLVLKAVNTS